MSSFFGGGGGGSGAVTSVNGHTGAVVLGASDVSAAPVASPTFTGIVTAPEFSASGLTGATSASRYVGATTSGAPASGTFAVGDFVVAQNGHIFVCTAAGTPGTWVDVGSVGNLVTSVAGRTGAVVIAEGDVTNLTSDLALKAPLASPALTGVPTAPTAAVDTNTTQLATMAAILAQAAAATPLIDGTAAVGTSTRYARGDHVHPTDTTRAADAAAAHLAGAESFTGIKTFSAGPALATQALSSNTTLADGSASVVLCNTSGGVFTATLPATPTTGTLFIFVDSNASWATNNLTIGRNGKNIDGAAANYTGDSNNGVVGLYYDGTGWRSIIDQLSNANPIIDGTAAPGTSQKPARADHVHPTDTTRAPLASPTFTGTTTAPEFSASGLTGATAASRYVGATASTSPASGTFAVGDFIVTQTGAMWICTGAGTPGTWTQVIAGSAAAGSITNAMLAGAITAAKLAGSITDDLLLPGFYNVNTMASTGTWLAANGDPAYAGIAGGAMTTGVMSFVRVPIPKTISPTKVSVVVGTAGSGLTSLATASVSGGQTSPASGAWTLTTSSMSGYASAGVVQVGAGPTDVIAYTAWSGTSMTVAAGGYTPNTTYANGAVLTAIMNGVVLYTSAGAFIGSTIDQPGGSAWTTASLKQGTIWPQSPSITGGAGNYIWVGVNSVGTTPVGLRVFNIGDTSLNAGPNGAYTAANRRTGTAGTFTTGAPNALVPANLVSTNAAGQFWVGLS